MVKQPEMCCLSFFTVKTTNGIYWNNTTGSKKEKRGNAVGKTEAAEAVNDSGEPEMS